jgi:hypothetical protein
MIKLKNSTYHNTFVKIFGERFKIKIQGDNFSLPFGWKIINSFFAVHPLEPVGSKIFRPWPASLVTLLILPRIFLIFTSSNRSANTNFFYPVCPYRWLAYLTHISGILVDGSGKIKVSGLGSGPDGSITHPNLLSFVAKLKVKR